jgi:pimeloyl-ACP methyl ester carboxylesterase
MVGEGRPLVLLHGCGADRSSWAGAGYVDELGSDDRLVNIDVRGHGASDKPHEAAAYTSEKPIPSIEAVGSNGTTGALSRGA